MLATLDMTSVCAPGNENAMRRPITPSRVNLSVYMCARDDGDDSSTACVFLLQRRARETLINRRRRPTGARVVAVNSWIVPHTYDILRNNSYYIENRLLVPPIVATDRTVSGFVFFFFFFLYKTVSDSEPSQRQTGLGENWHFRMFVPVLKCIFYLSAVTIHIV